MNRRVGQWWTVSRLPSVNLVNIRTQRVTIYDADEIKWGVQGLERES